MADAVAVQGLARRFGDRRAVDGVTLRLPAGEVHALIGANGAGKSTLMRLVAGLLRADAGTGEVLGLDLRRRQRAVAAAVGYAPQRTALHAELTVEETLRFRAAVHGVADARGRVAELVARFELEPYRRTRAGALSGGWARRLQLASALVHRPRLLLLDEPAAGLDHTAQAALWREVFATAGEGVAVLVNTHDAAEAERCDRATVLAEGRVRAEGAPAALAAEAHVAVFHARAGRLLDGPWSAERFGGGERYLLPEAEAGALMAAAAAQNVSLARAETRLEHAWPTLLASSDPSPGGRGSSQRIAMRFSWAK